MTSETRRDLEDGRARALEKCRDLEAENTDLRAQVRQLMSRKPDGEILLEMERMRLIAQEALNQRDDALMRAKLAESKLALAVDEAMKCRLLADQLSRRLKEVQRQVLGPVGEEEVTDDGSVSTTEDEEAPASDRPTHFDA